MSRFQDLLTSVIPDFIPGTLITKYNFFCQNTPALSQPE